MTNIALLPIILDKFLNGQDYTEELDNLRFLSNTAADKLTTILTNNRYMNLLQELTQDRLEQISALRSLFNNFRDNITENEIIEIYQTGILNSRTPAIIGSPPRSPIRVLQAPGAPARVRYERGAPNGNRRRRLNTDEEIVPIPFILPETFIEDHIRQFELNKSSECTICYENFETSNVCMNYPCGHVFHCRCIRTWARPTCPLCRQPVTQILENIELPRNVEFGKRKNKLIKVQSEIRYLNSI